MKKITLKSYYLFAAILITILVVIDQITKYLAIIYLKNTNGIDIIQNVFRLQYLENKGAAFGIMQEQQVFFFVMTLSVLILLTYIYGKIPVDNIFLPLRICVVFISAGAIGNMIDRVRFNYVVDFFYFELIDFPIFNVADIYVTVITIVLAFLILFYYKEEQLDQIQLWKKKNMEIKK